MKKFFILVSILLISATAVFAQKKVADEKYRRSSLCLMLLNDDDMPKKEVIVNSFLTSPVPDKYNDHNISLRLIDAHGEKVTDADREEFRKAVALAAQSGEGTAPTAPKKKSGFGAFAKGMAGAAVSTATGTSGQPAMMDSGDKEEYAALAYRHLLRESVAKQLFDKWFIAGGKFSMDLVGERGLYDASLMNVQEAKSSVRGMGALADAGEELVSNTFVVVSRYRYISKDDLVKEIEGALGSLAAQALKASLGAGYYVRTTSYLFQLNWNEEISNMFYTELWGKMGDYNASNIFALKYIGMESAFASVKAGMKTKKTEEELIAIATVNATDAVLAKLEKKYDVFKTKTPLLTVDPLTAAIGMKEGVEPGSKYEVLEKNVNPETNKTTYKRVAVIKAVKGQIADNRYAADEFPEEGVQPGLTVTTFEGATGLYPGLLLRQTK